MPQSRLAMSIVCQKPVFPLRRCYIIFTRKRFGRFWTIIFTRIGDLVPLWRSLFLLRYSAEIRTKKKQNVHFIMLPIKARMVLTDVSVFLTVSHLSRMACGLRRLNVYIRDHPHRGAKPIQTNLVRNLPPSRAA